MRVRSKGIVFCLALLTAGAMAQTTVTTTGGTAGTIPQFTGKSAIGNSVITQTGVQVGIGTSNTSQLNPLQVKSNGVDGGGIGMIGVVSPAEGNYGFAEFDSWLRNPTASPTDVFNWAFGSEGFYSPTGQLTNQDAYIFNPRTSRYNFAVDGKDNVYIGGQGYFNPGPTVAIFAGINGNVGLGTFNPGARLEVNGQVKIDSFASASATTVCKTASGVLSTCSSSLRYKEDVKDLDLGLKDVMQMRPVTFKWKDRDEKDFGLVAEDMHKINPLYNTYEKGEIEGVKYPQLSAVLVNAIKEQQGEIATLRGRVNDLQVDGTKQTKVTSGGDYAESVDVIGDRIEYGPGDVLVIDSKSPGKFLKSAVPYSTSVTGIYSTKPGTVGRRQETPMTGDEVPMAMMGIVPTNVTAENGPIRPGDLLVTSSTMGYAMKGTDRNKMMGAVIGKALGSLDSGKGVIEVVVTLQ